jgi:rod shape-determining protein MreC
VSVVVMVLDHRSSYLDTARYWLHSAVNPLYAIVQAPFDAWNWMTGSFADRSRLRTENQQLQEELRIARTKLLQFDSMNEENRRLRAIRAASEGIGDRTLIAEIIRVDVNPFRHLVRINKGSTDGVFKGQPILDAFGIVGQVMEVDRYSAQVILITDAEHATPVQLNRNGIRSIAIGIGDIDKLRLPYLTVEADVKVGDLLVSSGLDGVFPAGYPVARVSKVEIDPATTFAVVEADPLAELDRDREVLLLWVATPRPAQDAPVKREPPAAAKPNGKPPGVQAPSPPAPTAPQQ